MICQDGKTDMVVTKCGRHTRKSSAPLFFVFFRLNTTVYGIITPLNGEWENMCHIGFILN